MTARRHLVNVAVALTVLVMGATVVWPDHLSSSDASEESSQDQKSLASPRGADPQGKKAHPDEVSPEQRAMAAAYAATQVGEVYSMTAQPPYTWDCSKLTWYAYMLAGVPWPSAMALSYLQWRPQWYSSPRWTVSVPQGKEQVGDLVFFDWYTNASDAPRGLSGAKGVDHVGIVTDPERGLMVEAANPSAGVVASSYTTGPNADRIVGFARVLSKPAK